MVKGVILVDYTDQGRRTIKDSPDRGGSVESGGSQIGRSGERAFLHAKRTSRCSNRDRSGRA